MWKFLPESSNIWDTCGSPQWPWDWIFHFKLLREAFPSNNNETHTKSNMGVFKPSKRGRKKQQPLLKSTLPNVDENDLKAAALILLVEKSARKSPLLTTSECMTHAGLSLTVASNQAIQKRVRRLASKLDINQLLASFDKSAARTESIGPSFSSPTTGSCCCTIDYCCDISAPAATAHRIGMYAACRHVFDCRPKSKCPEAHPPTCFQTGAHSCAITCWWPVMWSVFVWASFSSHGARAAHQWHHHARASHWLCPHTRATHWQHWILQWSHISNCICTTIWGIIFVRNFSSFSPRNGSAQQSFVSRVDGRAYKHCRMPNNLEWCNILSIHNNLTIRLRNFLITQVICTTVSWWTSKPCSKAASQNGKERTPTCVPNCQAAKGQAQTKIESKASSWQNWEACITTVC